MPASALHLYDRHFRKVRASSASNGAGNRFNPSAPSLVYPNISGNSQQPRTPCHAYFVAAINRVGTELRWKSASFTAGYFCDPRVKLSPRQPYKDELLVAELNLDEIRKTSDTGSSTRRRPESYGKSRAHRPQIPRSGMMNLTRVCFGGTIESVRSYKGPRSSPPRAPHLAQLQLRRPMDLRERDIPT